MGTLVEEQAVGSSAEEQLVAIVELAAAVVAIVVR